MYEQNDLLALMNLCYLLFLRDSIKIYWVLGKVEIFTL